jgi:hypothetical protein
VFFEQFVASVEISIKVAAPFIRVEASLDDKVFNKSDKDVSDVESEDEVSALVLSIAVAAESLLSVAVVVESVTT